MATFEDVIALVDRATPVLRGISSAADDLLGRFGIVIDMAETPIGASGFDGMTDAAERTNEELDKTREKMQGMPDMQEPVRSGFEGWQQTVMGVNNAMQMAQRIIGTVQSGMQMFTDAADESIMAETRLVTVMQRTTGATGDQIRALQARTNEYQNLTGYSADALQAGLSELATYRLSADALSEMTGTLADFAAGQIGIKVSSEQMVQLANQLGKALDGNYGGLTKIGFAFTEAQEKIIDTGTDMERVAVLSEIIAESYGGLAEAFAATPAGKVEQLANAWGDVHKEIGLRIYPAIGQVSDAQLGLVQVLNPTDASRFYDALYAGAQLAGAAISAPIQAVSWLIDLFNQGNVPVRMLFYTTIATGAAIAATALWKVGVAGVTSAVSTIGAWAVAHTPFIAFGAAVGLGITMLDDLGVKAEDVAGFIGGVFYTVGAGIYNVFAKIGDAFIWLANKASYVGAFFGIGDGTQWEYNDLKDLNAAYEAGDQAGRDLWGGINDFFTFDPNQFGPDLSGANELDYVDELGKIKDPVNLAEEDLRYLLDERERRFMAEVNLQSPAPTVQLTVENINNGGDLANAMDYMAEKLREMSAANIEIQPMPVPGV